MSKNWEEYYRSVFDEELAKCINALENQPLNISAPESTSLRFLEAQEENDRLEAQRKELQMRQERLTERKANLQKKQEELRQYKLENAEKIQEKEAIRLRAIKKLNEEKDKIKELKKDNEKLREQLEALLAKKKLMDQRKLQGKHQETTAKVEDTGRDSDCGGAQSIRKEILERQEKFEHEQQELTENLKKKRTLLLHSHNTLQEKQRELEKRRLETRKWDTVPPEPSLEIPDLEELKLEELKESLSIVEQKQLLYAQMKDKIRSIYEMIAPYWKAPVEIEDTSAQLELIRKHFLLVKAIADEDGSQLRLRSKL